MAQDLFRDSLKGAPKNGLKFAKGTQFAVTIVDFLEKRSKLTVDNFPAYAHSAEKAPQYLELWRKTMKKAGIPIQYNEFAPEREAIFLLEAIEKWSKLSKERQLAIGKFFSTTVHDSVAGFIGKKMPEFEANGYGIAKFRRIYFGDTGDLFLRAKIIKENEERRNMAGAGKQTSDAA